MKSCLSNSVIIILVVSTFVIGCKNTYHETSYLPTFDLKNLPEIRDVKLSDLGFVDIKYVPLESKDLSFICNLYGIFNFATKLVVGHNFFIIKCGNNILKFRNDGSFETKIGRIGRGPNEITVVHDLAIDPETNNIYVLARWQKKIFVYDENGALIRTIQISNSPSELVICEDGILCYSENHMGDIINSFDVVDTTGAILKSFKNKYPFKNIDGYVTSGENLFYQFENQIFSKQVYSDTIYKYREGEFKPHLVIQVGDKLLTPEARSNNDGMYLGEHYIRPQNLFEFGDYLYYDFCYSAKIPNDVLAYRFIGSKKNGKYSLINFGDGLINDLDGGPNIQPVAKLDDYSIIAVVDALKFKTHIGSEFFRNAPSKYSEKKDDLEKFAEKIKETDNSILILISLRPF